MSSTPEPVRAMGIFKCPPHLSIEAFAEKCGALIDAVLALPQSTHISKYEMYVPNRAIDEHLESLGMPSPEGTIVITAHFTHLRGVDELLYDPEFKAMFARVKGDIGLHQASCTFAFDVITKK
ncbi:hypothetical protein C8R46DRAFT_1223778 [Mycena filopes]|nr:hypothetical protein C8R46DRAFT_1223778 [Mycena filopes]